WFHDVRSLSDGQLLSCDSSFSDSTGLVAGFMGFDSAANKIYVVFRGVQTTGAYNSDDFNELYTYPACSGCKVHKGLYWRFLNAYDAQIGQLASIAGAHPTAKIVI